VEDDHVDRPGMEVRQRMKFTGTNSSIGLIVLIPCAHRALRAAIGRHDKNSFSKQHALCRPGGYGGVAAPVPIPNTAVKRPSADGTSSQDAGE
jgi:hypothetical protein